jgi:hypothetical protein
LSRDPETSKPEDIENRVERLEELAEEIKAAIEEPTLPFDISTVKPAQ